MLIDTRLAERLKQIQPSSTLAITSKAKKLKAEGRDIVNLAAGEPDFDTPDFIKDAAILSIKNGFTKYTPTTGTQELKTLICEKFKKDNTLNYESNQIIVSCGAKHSIFNTLLALVNRNEEVLIPSPYWVSYPEMVKLCEGKPKFIKTSPENNFKINPKDLAKQIGIKTKVLILNSPSNPTGCVYAESELRQIADICTAKKIFVLADEIYEKIIYDNAKHISIASLDAGIYNLAVTVNGLSKSHSMTGWRIGYLGAPAYVAEAISKIQDHTTSNPASISQKAAVAALRAQDDFPKKMCAEFQVRRDYIIKGLNSIAPLRAIEPQGAFYVFCGISLLKLDSVTVANRLLEEASVAVIPGDAFGRNDYIRISFANSIEQIEKGLDRLKQWIAQL